MRCSIIPPAAFSRRDLIKGGALIVGFAMAGVPTVATAATGAAAGPPDPSRIDSWIAVHPDNTATVFLGKCELGQGNTTGLLQIAGEELDLDMSQLKTVRLDTNLSPNQGATTSSSSIHRGGPQVRAAAAEARQALLLLASTRLGVQTGSLTVSKGVVSIDGEPGRSVTYGELIGDKAFEVKFTGTAPQKPIGRYKLVGTRVPRLDIPDKVAGKYTHMQHVRVAGMLHGRVVRPRGQRGYGSGAKPIAIDEASIAGIAGARVIQRGDFVGVVAEREWDAVRAARDLKVTWQETAALPGNADLYDRMRATKTNDTVIASIGDPDKAFATAAHVASATFKCPYQAHAPFGPNCALADVGPDGALVMSSTQDIYHSRDMLAAVLGLPVGKVRVRGRCLCAGHGGGIACAKDCRCTGTGPSWRRALTYVSQPRKSGFSFNRATRRRPGGRRRSLRQSTCDGGFDEARREEGQRDRHIDELHRRKAELPSRCPGECARARPWQPR